MNRIVISIDNMHNDREQPIANPFRVCLQGVVAIDAVVFALQSCQKLVAEIAQGA